MIRVKMLNMTNPADVAGLEAIMNDVHIYKTAKLLDMDKVYNPKEGSYLVFVIYRELAGERDIATKTRATVAASGLTQDDSIEFPKFQGA